MKQNQQSITIKLTPELQEDLYQYLRLQKLTTSKSETQVLTELLQLGLSLETGTYTDNKIESMQITLNNLINQVDIQSKTIGALSQGIGDIEQLITQQTTDETLLIRD